MLAGLIAKGLSSDLIVIKGMVSGLLYGPLAGTHCDQLFFATNASPRHLLRKQLARLTERGWSLVVGLEVEWYLMRVVQDVLGDDNIGAPGSRGQPVRTAPIEPGYSYHSESNMDLMQPVLSVLAEAFERMHLPLRSVENEWGPGQVECTFAARGALEAADNLVLFGMARGSANVFEATYKVFGDIVSKQYPDMVPSYYPFAEVADTSYIQAIAERSAPQTPASSLLRKSSARSHRRLR